MLFLPEDRASVERRFLAKVSPEPNTGCWLWTASVTNRGYGELMIRHTQRCAYAHRVSFALYNGLLPDDVEVRHTCDVPCCVNPSHLIVGTHADNMQDMARRGRSRFGRCFPDEQTLSDDAVMYIVRDPRRPFRVIAADFGVTPQYVGQLKRGLYRAGASCA